MSKTADWRAALRALPGTLREGVPLAPYTTFRLGGPAELLFEPATAEACAEALRLAKGAGVAVHVLGGGTNTLVADAGVRGLVILLSAKPFTGIEFVDDGVRAGAGASLPKLVQEAARRGYGGFAELAGIPGSAGGAVAMNAGGRYGETKDVVRAVTLLDGDGMLKTVPRAGIPFGYRRSGLAGKVVLSVEFEKKRCDKEAALKMLEEAMGYKHATQPMAAHSAGCAFKNPPGQSAGKLIDEAGLKGARVGKAVISQIHGNFFVNEGGATAADMLALIDLARRTVKEKTGVELESEVQRWGFEGQPTQ